MIFRRSGRTREPASGLTFETEGVLLNEQQFLLNTKLDKILEQQSIIMGMLHGLSRENYRIEGSGPELAPNSETGELPS